MFNSSTSYVHRGCDANEIARELAKINVDTYTINICTSELTHEHCELLLRNIDFSTLYSLSLCNLDLPIDFYVRLFEQLVNTECEHLDKLVIFDTCITEEFVKMLLSCKFTALSYFHIDNNTTNLKECRKILLTNIDHFPKLRMCAFGKKSIIINKEFKEEAREVIKQNIGQFTKPAKRTT